MGQSHPATVGLVFLETTKRRHHEAACLVAVLSPVRASDHNVEALLQVGNRLGLGKGVVPSLHGPVWTGKPFRFMEGRLRCKRLNHGRYHEGRTSARCSTTANPLLGQGSRTH